MSMNPCGRICDIGREGYTQPTRVFRDSEETADVIWYPARDDAPVLDCPSTILNDVWNDDRADDTGRPLVPDSYWSNQRNFEPKKLTALGLHQCGTAEDFAEGCHYDPDAPPIEYRANGLPVCCPPVIEGQTQGRCGMRATVSYTPPSNDTCPTALPCEFGVVYPGTVSTFDDRRWYRWTISDPGVYRVTPGGAVAGCLYRVHIGSTCEDSFIAGGGVTPNTFDFVGTVGTYAWVVLYAYIGVPQSFAVRMDPL